jgi:3-hydroxyacyl-CoA dehydrogenase/enoyl-CoA hydratase/3-hydroxybutyryl-CoA epimerase
MELRFARQTRGEDGIAILTLDYPESKVNKLSDEVWEELGGLAQSWASDQAIRGVVIESAKRSIFMAGADIAELQDMRDPAVPDRKSATGHRVLNLIERCGKPVVSAVAGAALGGGLELVLATHAAVVADDEKVKLGLPETKLGLIPGAGGTQRLSRRIGADRAAQLIVSGESFDGKAAVAMGLAAKAVSREDVTATARALALELAARGGFTPQWDGRPAANWGSLLLRDLLALDKNDLRFAAWTAAITTVYAGSALPFDEALALEREAFSRIAVLESAHSLIRQFLSGVRL